MTDYYQNINFIFNEISNQISSLPKSKKMYSDFDYQLDRLKLNNIVTRNNKEPYLCIEFLEFSLEEYRQTLSKVTDPISQEIAVKSAEKLKEAISTILDDTKNDDERNNSILVFDKQARNSNLSEGEYLLIGCLIGALAGLLITVGSPVGLAIGTIISAMAIGGMISDCIFEQGETKSGNKNMVSDIKLLAFEREKWLFNGSKKSTSVQHVDDNASNPTELVPSI